MFGLKVKFALRFMAVFLITIHCSHAVEYDEDFDDEGNSDDFSKSQPNFDDMENEDAQISQTSLYLGRQSRRRLHSGTDRRPGSGRRRWGWG